MEYNFDKLISRIEERYGNRENFCRETGYSKALLSLKLNNHNGFTRKDISSFSSYLNIPQWQIGEYFFTPKV